MDKFAKLVESNLDGFRGKAKLYQLSTPLLKESRYDGEERRYFDYVVVSQANVVFSGPETYIFGADKDGTVVDWCELDGSRRGAYTHAEVLREAGYEVIED